MHCHQLPDGTIVVQGCPHCPAPDFHALPPSGASSIAQSLCHLSTLGFLQCFRCRACSVSHVSLHGPYSLVPLWFLSGSLCRVLWFPVCVALSGFSWVPVCRCLVACPGIDAPGLRTYPPKGCGPWVLHYTDRVPAAAKPEQKETDSPHTRSHRTEARTSPDRPVRLPTYHPAHETRSAARPGPQEGTRPGTHARTVRPR